MGAIKELSRTKLSFTAVVTFAIAALIALATVGCKNAFLESANKTSDEALLFEAQKQIDLQEYGEAIELIQTMTDTGQARRSVKLILASAYAGSCGLNLMELADNLGSGDASTLFQMLLSAYKTGTVDSVTACNNAEATLLSVATAAADRTADENVLLAFVEFVKIGVILATTADTADDDGTVDTSTRVFDSCSSVATTPSDVGISDTDIGELGTGITIALSSIQAAGVSTADGATSAISSLCGVLDTTIGAFDPTYAGFCDKTDPSEFSAIELKALRSLTRSNEIGLKTCDDTITNCLCMPFP